MTDPTQAMDFLKNVSYTLGQMRNEVNAAADNVKRDMTVKEIQNSVSRTYGKDIDAVQAQRIKEGLVVRIVPDDWISLIEDPHMRAEI